MKIKFASLLAAIFLFCAGPAAADDQKISAGCVPGISFWSLLGAVGIGYADGHLHMEKLYAVCLPTPKTSADSNYAYDPDHGGKLTTVLKSADGQALTTYVWYGENISSLWELSNYKILGGYEAAKPLGAGHYVLEFQVEGATISRFPFSVATAASDDPYQPAGTRYFIEGPWNDYGNVFYQRNDPESSLRFTIWVQAKLTHDEQRSASYEAQLVRVRDGKVLGQDKGELRAAPQWRQLDVSFQADPTTHIKAGDLLREDGTYGVRFTMDGKLYGVYSFVVSGGKIQMQGRQLESTEPANRIVDYLYGGRYRSWWIPRTGGEAPP